MFSNAYRPGIFHGGVLKGKLSENTDRPKGSNTSGNLYEHIRRIKT